MNIEPIGYVKNDIPNPTDENWSEVISDIILDVNYATGLFGLEKFSHALIIFFMHKASFVKEKHLVRHPRERLDLPKIGIFAQRAKHRPNPIGITTVKIVGVDNNILTVKGLDAINETPVIDIKPYNPYFDKMDKSKMPKWVDEVMKDYF
ncbi:MAG: tRNA (N6-threonylcarbamoyladenosine(37)-N6)-methyltransferase TrmO [Asgard group archaeon]|nr:tRNA (N6-threonylcarbamoyladenosine(37)-N6)-methyltransferase TrmO [Asgard group archaeon]